LALKQLRLDPNSVKNVYLIGSRLWQTQHPKSDYDLLVVLSSYKSSVLHNNKIQKIGKKEGKRPTKKTLNVTSKLNESHLTLHAGNFDALVYDEALFIKRFGLQLSIE
jgi:predicted nucleotidyltransferase